jgi:hypothetical protein
MKRKLTGYIWVLALAAFLMPAAQAEETDGEVAALKEDVKDLEKRLMKVERSSALDRVAFSGDFRFEAHSIQASVPAHFDGMTVQNNLVNGLVGMGYLPDTNVDFDELKQAFNTAMGDIMSIPDPAVREATIQAFQSNLVAGAYSPGGDADNDIMYTSRLRLNLRADVADNVTFDGRLGMYKVWGDSTAVQVFNGQPTSIGVDGTTVGVPNSDILRVERAYFTWKDIAGSPTYLSIGRRPSTGGVPLHLRDDELRGGTPMGSLINYQFDGATLGYKLTDESTLRLCYGVGYESGFGNGEPLDSPHNDLKDASFLGINWDILNNEETFIQTTVARAFNVTDGFNGTVVMNNNPVTGDEIGAPLVMRYSPSADLGDIDLASIVLLRDEGLFDWFVSANYMHSNPNNVTTPFGGLFCDPFEVPEEQDGYMLYAGTRFKFNDDKTKIGLEYNHGSEYWFNFALAEDDIIAPKTGARGDVVETYITHRIHKNFVAKLSYIYYHYNYSGSSWHMGAPKDLDETPVLGAQTYDEASMVSLGLSARF